MTCLKEPATGPIAEPLESIHQLISLRSILMGSSHSCVDFLVTSFF
jgi:hypothetical protein